MSVCVCVTFRTLARQQGARVNRLALRENIGVLLAARLIGREPLECRRLGGGGVVDAELEVLALGVLLAKVDGEGGACVDESDGE